MRYRVEGPDGATHVLEADNEAALHDAIEELWGDPKEPEPEKPDHMPAVVELLLERIANRPDPVFPEIPKFPEFPKLPKPERVDIEGPLGVHAGHMAVAIEGQTGDLRAVLASHAKEIALLRADLLTAIAGLHAALMAPREITERDRQGRAIRAQVVT